MQTKTKSTAPAGTPPSGTPGGTPFTFFDLFIPYHQYVNSIVDSLARLYGQDDIIFIVKNDREIPEKEKIL